VLQSLSQTLGLVAPSVIAFLAPERDAKHDKRGDRDEGNNPSHLRSPMRVWAIEDNAGFLISCLESWLTGQPDARCLNTLALLRFGEGAPVHKVPANAGTRSRLRSQRYPERPFFNLRRVATLGRR
jgi:hypothetical protein